MPIYNPSQTSRRLVKLRCWRSCLLCQKSNKKPTWGNISKCSPTSAYSSTSLPANRAALCLVVRQLELTNICRAASKLATARPTHRKAPPEENKWTVVVVPSFGRARATTRTIIGFPYSPPHPPRHADIHSGCSRCRHRAAYLREVPAEPVVRDSPAYRRDTILLRAAETVVPASGM